MLEFLLNLDRELLFFINRLPHNILTNNFFLFFSIAGYFGIIWFILTILLVLFDGLDNRREFLTLFIAVIVSFFIVEIFLKNAFLRLRPEAVFPGNLILIMDESNSYSFPSGHATTAFAAAYILTRQRKKLSLFFYSLALLVAISRIYLGRHYPSDVLSGAIFGLIIGVFCFNIVIKIFPYKK